MFAYSAATNFFWTASHAIGAHSSSRSHTPNHLNNTQLYNTELPSESQYKHIGTSLQPNTLAPGATHRPSLPATSTIQTPPCISSIEPSLSQLTEESLNPLSQKMMESNDISKLPPCDGCGAAIQ